LIKERLMNQIKETIISILIAILCGALVISVSGTMVWIDGALSNNEIITVIVSYIILGISVSSLWFYSILKE